LEWNLANDPSFGPRTAGACTECKGALTIKTVAERNVSYYIIAQASKFIPSGSVRVASNLVFRLPNVAFVTPSGSKVLIVLNENAVTSTFNLKYKDKWAVVTLPAQAAATFVWK
jgi:glucosylceramidase